MANKLKYLPEDFDRYERKEITVQELCQKYNVSLNTMRKAINRRGIHPLKKRIVIKTPYKTLICESVNEASDELRVSRTTVYYALKGRRIPLFEEMGIEIYEEKK